MTSSDGPGPFTDYVLKTLLVQILKCYQKENEEGMAIAEYMANKLYVRWKGW